MTDHDELLKRLDDFAELTGNATFAQAAAAIRKQDEQLEAAKTANRFAANAGLVLSDRLEAERKAHDAEASLRQKYGDDLVAERKAREDAEQKLQISLCSTKARFIGEFNHKGVDEWWYPGRRDLYMTREEMLKRANEFEWHDDPGGTGYLWPFVGEYPMLYATDEVTELLSAIRRAEAAEADATQQRRRNESYIRDICKAEAALAKVFEETRERCAKVCELITLGRRHIEDVFLTACDEAQQDGHRLALGRAAEAIRALSPTGQPDDKTAATQAGITRDSDIVSPVSHTVAAATYSDGYRLILVAIENMDDYEHSWREVMAEIRKIANTEYQKRPLAVAPDRPTSQYAYGLEESARIEIESRKAANLHQPIHDAFKEWQDNPDSSFQRDLETGIAKVVGESPTELEQLNQKE